jgi:hypothetical protein
MGGTLRHPALPDAGISQRGSVTEEGFCFSLVSINPFTIIVHGPLAESVFSRILDGK